MKPGLKRKSTLWILAIVITLSSVVYQRMTGPTYPVRISEEWQGHSLSAKLRRTHGGAGEQPVVVEGAGEGLEGELIWRRYPTNEEFRGQEMVRDGERLTGRLPHQPPAGKIEYRVEIQSAEETLHLPERGTVVTRFKGAVPLAVLIPHVIFMFAAMLLSNRAAFEAAAGGKRQGYYALLAFITLGIGGMILGPIVQKYAFGAYWTGIPFGHDLTDNKTLIAFLGWLAAIVLRRMNRGGRAPVLVAALITLAIYLIPHSTLGSELSYE